VRAGREWATIGRFGPAARLTNGYCESRGAVYRALCPEACPSGGTASSCCDIPSVSHVFQLATIWLPLMR
jgi:hypothetical protein